MGIFTGYHSWSTELDVLHYQSVVRCQIQQLNPRLDDGQNSISVFKENNNNNDNDNDNDNDNNSNNKKNDRVFCFAFKLFCLFKNFMILKKKKVVARLDPRTLGL